MNPKRLIIARILESKEERKKQAELDNKFKGPEIDEDRVDFFKQ